MKAKKDEVPLDFQPYRISLLVESKEDEAVIEYLYWLSGDIADLMSNKKPIDSDLANEILETIGMSVATV